MAPVFAAQGKPRGRKPKAKAAAGKTETKTSRKRKEKSLAAPDACGNEDGMKSQSKSRKKKPAQSAVVEVEEEVPAFPRAVPAKKLNRKNKRRVLKAAKGKKKGNGKKKVAQSSGSTPMVIELEDGTMEASRSAHGKTKTRRGKGKTQKMKGEAKEAGGGENEVPKPDGGKVPPPHVTANGVYSSAYRKAKAAGDAVEDARAKGKRAADIFRKYGVVTDLCGTFREVKRNKAQQLEGGH